MSTTICLADCVVIVKTNMTKETLAADEKFDKIDFDLFDALAAIDRKDYSYYDRLTVEQQKKFVPFMMLHWVSAVKGAGNLQSYYLQSVNHHANMYLFNENVQKHPKLAWLMLCASSPGIGKQFHQWIPHIKDRVSKLKEHAKSKDIKEYYKKIYPRANVSDIDDMTETFVAKHKRKMYIAERFSDMKLDEIELLSEIISDEDIEEYERSLGNR